VLNRQATQFYVAVVAIVGLVLLTGLALVCAAFGAKQSQVVDNVLLLLVGGLVSGAGTAMAYLFRLNGKAGSGSGSEPPASG
jgi:hypothetical protein